MRKFWRVVGKKGYQVAQCAAELLARFNRKQVLNRTSGPTNRCRSKGPCASRVAIFDCDSFAIKNEKSKIHSPFQRHEIFVRLRLRMTLYESRHQHLRHPRPVV